ncbi:hypothetical protein BH23CYA1_BH23CYA1_09340 [soil metagenome]
MGLAIACANSPASTADCSPLATAQSFFELRSVPAILRALNRNSQPELSLITVADLIIPAALRLWLVFLLVFVLLRYPVPFSILFGAIGGFAGGLLSAWSQVKGGAPQTPKGMPPTDKLIRPDPDGSDVNPRWELPFMKTNKAKQRYIERQKRARDRRVK